MAAVVPVMLPVAVDKVTVLPLTIPVCVGLTVNCGAGVVYDPDTDVVLMVPATTEVNVNELAPVTVTNTLF